MLFKPLEYLLVTATQHGKNASRRIPGTSLIGLRYTRYLSPRSRTYSMSTVWTVGALALAPRNFGHWPGRFCSRYALGLQYAVAASMRTTAS